MCIRDRTSGPYWPVHSPPYRSPADRGPDRARPRALDAGFGRRMAAADDDHRPRLVVGLTVRDRARRPARAESPQARARSRHRPPGTAPVSYTHLRAHETVLDLVCR